MQKLGNKCCAQIKNSKAMLVSIVMVKGNYISIQKMLEENAFRAEIILLL